MDYFIRKAGPEHAEHFVELMLMSAPYFPDLFGAGIDRTLKKLYEKRGNLFSHEHVWLLEKEGKPAAMLLGYDHTTKKKENLSTGILLFRYLHYMMLKNIRTLLQFNKTIGVLQKGEFYISNIGTFPAFRRQGLARILMLKGEETAKQQGNIRMVLDVEKENIPAIRLYRTLEYHETDEFFIPFDKQPLTFLRMKKTTG